MKASTPGWVVSRLTLRAARVIAAASGPHRPHDHPHAVQPGPRRTGTQLARRVCIARRVGDERGAAAVWTMIIVTTAFVALMGLVGGGGELINQRVEAKRAAEQAARAGADELSASAVRSGNDQVDAGDAIARANSVLSQAGWSGSVQVHGSRVVVTATGSRKPQFLSLIGVGAIRVSETGTADAISTPDG